MTQKKHNWLLYAIITMVTWGIWGAFSDQTTLPKTMVYVIWALSMIPCALAALVNIRFKLDVRTKPALLSLLVGLLGAGGQLVLFLALDYAPAYLVMPMISVAPIVTVLLSATVLKEKVSKLGILGIALAFVALVCFALPDSKDGAATSRIWILFASIVFICWGVQAFVMKLANNNTPDAESVFVYGQGTEQRPRRRLGGGRQGILRTAAQRHRRFHAGLCQPLWEGDGHRPAGRRLRPGDHVRDFPPPVCGRSYRAADHRHRGSHQLRPDFQQRVR